MLHNCAYVKNAHVLFQDPKLIDWMQPMSLGILKFSVWILTYYFNAIPIDIQQQICDFLLMPTFNSVSYC